MRKLRIGLLGASRIAPIAVIQPVAKRDDCEIVALACRDVSRGRAYAEANGLPGIDVIESYAALCARDDIDIVYNALPPSLHLETARAASGKTQLIEKPFAMNAEEAAQIAVLPGLIMEAFHNRYHPAVLYFLQQVGALGELNHIEGRFHVSIPDGPTAHGSGQLRYIPELGGGSLMDLGCYPLQLARTVAGREPEVTRANAVYGDNGVELAIEADLDFGNGLDADISSDMREGTERQNFVEVTGAKGTVRIENPVHPYRHCVVSGPDGDVSRAGWSELTTYDAQLDELLACLRDGREPVTGAQAAVAQMRAIDAIYGAAQSA